MVGPEKGPFLIRLAEPREDGIPRIDLGSPSLRLRDRLDQCGPRLTGRGYPRVVLQVLIRPEKEYA
jgi:hypothetical protein